MFFNSRTIRRRVPEAGYMDYRVTKKLKLTAAVKKSGFRGIYFSDPGHLLTKKEQLSFSFAGNIQIFF